MSWLIIIPFDFIFFKKKIIVISLEFFSLQSLFTIRLVHFTDSIGDLHLKRFEVEIDIQFQLWMVNDW